MTFHITDDEAEQIRRTFALTSLLPDDDRHTQAADAFLTDLIAGRVSKLVQRDLRVLERVADRAEDALELVADDGRGALAVAALNNVVARAIDCFLDAERAIVIEVQR